MGGMVGLIRLQAAHIIAGWIALVWRSVEMSSHRPRRCGCVSLFLTRRRAEDHGGPQELVLLLIAGELTSHHRAYGSCTMAVSGQVERGVMVGHRSQSQRREPRDGHRLFDLRGISQAPPSFAGRRQLDGANARHTMTRQKVDHGADATEQVIWLAIEVHRHTGPGLLETMYGQCLCHEFTRGRHSIRASCCHPDHLQSHADRGGVQG